MAPKSKFTPEQQAEIKADLFNGMSNKEIAAKYNLGAGYVSNIKNGYNLASVQWPDGTTGPMPILKAEALKQNRAFESKVGRNTGMGGSTGGWLPNSWYIKEWYNGNPDDNRYVAAMLEAKEAGFEHMYDYMEYVAARAYQQAADEQRAKDEAYMAQVTVEIEARRKYREEHGIVDPPPTPRSDQLPLDPSTMKQMDWEDVSKRFADLKVVQEAIAAEGTEAQITRSAICIAFYSLETDSSRRGSQHEMFVRQVAKQIRSFIEQHGEDQGEQAGQAEGNDRERQAAAV